MERSSELLSHKRDTKCAVHGYVSAAVDTSTQPPASVAGSVPSPRADATLPVQVLVSKMQSKFIRLRDDARPLLRQLARKHVKPRNGIVASIVLYCFAYFLTFSWVSHCIILLILLGNLGVLGAAALHVRQRGLLSFLSPQLADKVLNTSLLDIHRKIWLSEVRVLCRLRCSRGLWPVLRSSA